MAAGKPLGLTCCLAHVAPNERIRNGLQVAQVRSPRSLRHPQGHSWLQTHDIELPAPSQGPSSHPLSPKSHPHSHASFCSLRRCGVLSASGHVSALSTSRSSGITQADLERLASLCQRLALEEAANSGREEVQIDLAAEVHALRLLLEEADLTLGELEALVLRFRGEPFSRCFQRVAGWTGVCILPSLRSECGMTRRQVAEAIVKFPGLLTTYTGDAATLARRLRWHLCTDWGSKAELGGEAGLAATLVREPRLVALDRDALKVKIHEMLRLLVNPELPVPEDVVAGTGPISWQRHYCSMLQPALRDHPRALVGRGVKNMRQRIAWTAAHLSMQQRATPEGARLLVIAAGLDVKLVESRLKMLRQATGLEQPAALRDFLLGCPEMLLADAKAVDAAYQLLLGRCLGDQSKAQSTLQRLLRQHRSKCAEYAEAFEL